MLLTKRLRRWIAYGVMLALLSMQLAVAAYACPQMAQASQPAVMAMAMPGCDGMSGAMDPEQPQLCQAHCVNDAQGTGTAAAPDLQPNPAALTLLVGIVEPLPPALPAAFAAGQTGTLARPPGAPPLYLSLLILRN